MEFSEIKLSVALVTRNRSASLERTLKSLRAQEVQPWEVIISDDSDEEYIPEVQCIAAKYGCRYITGPHLGLYANRNHVATACGGTHIRTMDDDHEFPAGHFQDCLNAIIQDASSIWIIGEYSVMSKDNIHKYAAIKDFIIVDNYEPGNIPKGAMPCPGQLNSLGISEEPADPQNCWAISDGASVIPKSVFDNGIYYMDYFPFGASYLEFGSRLYWLKYRIRHLASTYIIHHYDPSARSFMNVTINLSSRIFAMLCHSFIYQPTWRNKAMSCLVLIKHLALHQNASIDAIKTGWSEYIKHRKKIKIHLKSRSATNNSAGNY